MVQQPTACFSLVLKSQVEPEKRRIQTEFKQLRSILDREEQRELKKLEVEERKGLSIIEKAEGDLIHQSQSLKDLISDLEHRCRGSTVELLQVLSYEEATGSLRQFRCKYQCYSFLDKSSPEVYLEFRRSVVLSIVLQEP